jgi:dTDP-4-dehydrorhamnose reductase
MNIAILGHTGMLGHVMEKVFKKEYGASVSGFGRPAFDVYPRKLNDVGTKLSTLFGMRTDYVINCIGAIKPTFSQATDLSVPIYTNAVFPHQLATWGELTNTKIIHITTDCVFSGHKGQYTEIDPHDALDVYGKSKSLGEPENAMVIRTSIFGPEFGGRKRSFLEWVKGQRDKSVSGFTNHYWNGLTTLELANSLLDIVASDVWTKGLFHVFSEDVSKYDMVTQIAEAYNLNIEVNPHDTDFCIDRTLRTEKDLNDFLQPAAFSNMLYDLVDFESELT